MAPLHPEVRPELKRITFFFLINVTDEAWYAACIRMSLRHTTTTRFVLLNFLNHTLSKKNKPTYVLAAGNSSKGREGYDLP